MDVLHEQRDRVAGRPRPACLPAPRREGVTFAFGRGNGGEPDRGRGVHGPEPSSQEVGRLGLRKIRLGQDQPVGERDLLHGLRKSVELGGGVDRIHHCHHHPGAVVVAEYRIGGQGMHDGSGVREPGGLDHHPVVTRRLTPFAPAVEVEERTSQVVAYRTAHAAVVEEHHALRDRFEQVVIEADLPKLVHEHRGGGEPGRGEEPGAGGWSSRSRGSRSPR